MVFIRALYRRVAESCTKGMGESVLPPAGPRRVGVAGSGTLLSGLGDVDDHGEDGGTPEHLVGWGHSPQMANPFFPLADSKVELGCYFYSSVLFGKGNKLINRPPAPPQRLKV